MTPSAKQKALKKEAQDWVARALGTFIFAQAYDLKLPAFPLGATGYTLVVMSGRDDELIAACKEFIATTQPLLAKAYDATGERGGT